MSQTTSAPPVLPQEGQVVQVRGEYWAVTDVSAQGLPRSPADEVIGTLQHAVTLQSISEERLGEEMRVVWELEPGRIVLPDRGLPSVDADHFDEPATLAAFVDALRWGAVTSADARTLQAPFRSGAVVEAYQLEPVRRALQASRANLLLADDVGLGKTIEAGLVIQELLLRHRARNVIVVCPAGLVLKWQDEMREKFGLDFEIVNSETMRQVRRTHGLHANPFTLFPRVIVSMSWLPGERAQRLLQEVYAHVDSRTGARRSAFDILVVDEAHHVAPASPQRGQGNGPRRGYAVDTHRTRAVRGLAERCEHRLFLSATPHNGYTESFTALLEMIDDRRFARGASLDRAALEDVVVRRLKRDLAEQKGFKPRVVKSLPFDPTADEDQAYERLDDFIRRREQAVRGVSGRRAKDLTTILLKKRFFSSPVAFARTVDAYLTTRGLEELSDVPDVAQVLGAGADDMEEGRTEQQETQTLRQAGRVLPPLTDEDVSELDALHRWGTGYEGRADSRLKALLTLLDAVLRPDGTHWSNERVVVFTEYVDTLRWIEEVLRSRGFDGDRLAVIEGATDPEDRELIRARFQEHPSKTDVRVLLATDAAGEGIDLQDHCHRLVNFDIPFNPNRLEQRIGRIDRYGQEFSPEVFHLVPPGGPSASGYSRDTEFLVRIADKIARVEVDLGSANEVIAHDIHQRMSGRGNGGVEATTVKTLRGRDDELATAVLHGEREVRRELTELEEHLEASRRRLHLSPANLERVVSTALAMDHQPPLVQDWDDDGERVLGMPGLSPRWTPVTRGLATRLDPDRLRPITFDEELAKGRTDLVLVHLGHPLVQRSTRLLRSALWGDRSDVNRVSAVVVDGLEESFAAAVTRLVLVGRGGVRLHEEVFLAGTRLDQARALGVDLSERLLEEALDAERLTTAPQSVRVTLAERWADAGPKGLRARVEQSLRDRAERRQSAVEKSLRERQTADLRRVDEVFDRFRHTLEETLRKASAAQTQAEATLFELEQRQRETDLRRITERLQTLNDERHREHNAVARRYADVTAYAFPAAVVFALTPQSVTR